MGKTCSVAICPSPKDAIYHAFPSDLIIQKQWIHLCKREGFVNAKTAKVCSCHFNEEDYERDLKCELLGLPPKKRLKSTAVPSLKLLPGKITSFDCTQDFSTLLKHIY